MSLYKPKKGIGPISLWTVYTERNSMKKKEFNLGKLDTKEAEKFRTKSNNDFEEITRFANVYNRCIGFNSMEWHAANEFSQKDEKESRLTLIIFWSKLVVK